MFCKYLCCVEKFSHGISKLNKELLIKHRKTYRWRYRGFFLVTNALAVSWTKASAECSKCKYKCKPWIMLHPLHLNSTDEVFQQPQLWIRTWRLTSKELYQRRVFPGFVSSLVGSDWRWKVTPLLLSRDTLVTKNKLETSLIVVSSGQRARSLTGLKTYAGVNNMKLIHAVLLDSHSDYWFCWLG